MVREAEKFQIGDEFVTIPGATNFILEHMPKKVRSKKAAYDGIYNAITAAQRKGELPVGPAFKAQIFWTWAVAQKRWSHLTLVNGLSYSAVILADGVFSEGQVGQVSAVDLPNDLQSLRAVVAQQKIELDLKERELAEVKIQLEGFLAAKRRRSAVASANGKQGGRGKAK